jgi:beta-aspartyl-peptidase (threonine type)
MATGFKFEHAKPYLYILAFLIVPILFVPILRKVKSKSSFYQTQALVQDSIIPTKSLVNYGLAIHGGAGNFSESDIPTELQVAYKAKMYEALELGMAKVEQGDSAPQVVLAVIKILEDSPLFNAGKGAVFNHDGKNELDASIMDGSTKSGGAVAGVSQIKNPIEAAFRVMKQSPHVLLSGKGAEQFAREQNLEMVEANYFYTDKQWDRLQKLLSSQNKKMGTVGCVVLDSYGNLGAGTSTGGMSNKKYGRIGDSPILGAGTYADNATCAISATGHGEYFIRYTVAYDIAARIKYLNQTLEQSADIVIDQLKQNGGSGGVIGIDSKGQISMKFNTNGMFRGYYTKGASPELFLFKN